MTYPSLEGDVSCDVVVLGGGVTGALVAFHLAEAGFDTVVLDKREIGCGSTAATTALIQYEIDTSLVELAEMLGTEHATRTYVACREAIDKIEAVTRRLGDGCGFERRKSLYFASEASHVADLRSEYEARRKLGFRIDWLDEADLAEAFGFRRPAALRSHDAAQVDPFRLTHELLRVAAARGTRVFARTRAIGISAERGGVHIRTDEGSTVRASRMVFATGYESQQYLETRVARLTSTYAVASTPADGIRKAVQHHLIWESARPYFYMRTTEDHRILMGGEDEEFQDSARRDGLLKSKTKSLIEKFRDLFPDVPLEAAFAWAGTFGETKDGLAYIDRTPEWPGAYFALGYGGNGITYSILAAEIIRDALLGKPNEHADLFRFDR